jgi:hypothetical protein
MPKVVKAKNFLSDIPATSIKINDKVVGAHGKRGVIENIDMDDGELVFDFKWIAEDRYTENVHQSRCSKVEYRGKKW